MGAALVLAACGGPDDTGTTTPPPPPPPASHLSGRVSSGLQPLSGATVTLYAAGATGYGAGDATLGTGHSDGNGEWTVDYTCPTDSTPVYLVATGGNAGQGANAAVALSVAPGACGSLPQTLTMNEVTTVASTYALNAFLDVSGVHLGAPGSNGLGLRNAQSMLGNLVDLATGRAATALAAPATGFPPTATLNTLADVLASCAGSSGPASSPCVALFNASRGTESEPPTNTLQAIVRIARHPGSEVNALYALVSTSSPFQPVLSGEPGDWLLPVELTGGGLQVPEAVAIDAQGNAWVSNYGPAVAEFSPAGVAVSGAAGFTGGGLKESFDLAIDQAGHVWVVNEESDRSVNSGLGSLTELGPDGTVLSGPSGYVSSILFPQSVAVDAAGHVWVANYGDGAHHSFLSEFIPGGGLLSPPDGYMGGGMGFPVSLAIDSLGNLWLADLGAGNVALFSASGEALSPSTGLLDVGGALMSGPSGVCLDSGGTPWVTLGSGDAVVQLRGASSASRGAPVSPAGGYTGGGLTHPLSCAADSAGRIWITNYHGASLTVLQGSSDPAPGTPLSGSVGWAAGLLASPTGIAIDASGNVWVGNSDATVNSVTVLVGAAAPVRTPLIGPPARP